MRALLLCLLATSCSFGPRVSKFGPATHVAGLGTMVARGDSTFGAELLAVTDTALLLVRDSRIVLARYRSVDRIDFLGLSEQYTITRGRPPVGQVREQLRLFSRYPPGVPASLLAELLAAYHQDSVDVLRP
jgi:hypothetical protein